MNAIGKANTQGERNMEKLAENRFTITQKLYMEAMLRMSEASYGKTAGKGICLILGAWCAILIYVIAAEKNPGQMLNCTPFVRQVWYNTCTKKWGVFLCLREYQTNDILESLSKWWSKP